MKLYKHIKKIVIKTNIKIRITTKLKKNEEFTVNEKELNKTQFWNLQVIKNGLDKLERETSRSIFYKGTEIEHHCKYTYEQAIEIRKEQEKFNKILWQKAIYYNKNQYARERRIKKRIEKMLIKNCIFLTLTFTNEIINNTTEETRRIYIKRFLEGLKCNYIANIDFGKKFEREHYHAIVDCEKVDKNLYKYGSINFKRIKKTSSESALAKYILKLTKHAIKKTTKGKNLLYSRKKY